MVKNKIIRRSTENSSSNAWNLNLNDGNLNNWNDKSNSNKVRPVSALIRKTENRKRNDRFCNTLGSIYGMP